MIFWTYTDPTCRQCLWSHDCMVLQTLDYYKIRLLSTSIATFLVSLTYSVQFRWVSRLLQAGCHKFNVTLHAWQINSCINQMIQLIINSSPRLQWTLVLSLWLQFVSIQLATTSDRTRCKHILAKPGYRHNQIEHITKTWTTRLANRCN